MNADSARNAAFDRAIGTAVQAFKEAHGGRSCVKANRTGDLARVLSLSAMAACCCHSLLSRDLSGRLLLPQQLLLPQPDLSRDLSGRLLPPQQLLLLPQPALSWSPAPSVVEQAAGARHRVGLGAAGDDGGAGVRHASSNGRPCCRLLPRIRLLATGTPSPCHWHAFTLSLTRRPLATARLLVVTAVGQGGGGGAQP